MGRRKKEIKLEDYMIQIGPQGKSWKETRDDEVVERVKVKGLTKNQDRYLKAIETSVITICVGPAGTGKTWMACGTAAQMLRERRIERIILSRPIQGCDEDPGFLPGDMSEKYGPVMQPMFDAFGDFLSRKEIEEYKRDEQIMVVPLAFMRGRTFHNAMVILDEAQNATFGQLRMLLTRFGKDSRVVVNGDHTQSDLRKGEPNPLFTVIKKFQDRPGFKLTPISVVRMTRADIVRHPLIQWIDETLSDDYGNEQESKHEAAAWHTIRCPECRTSMWYEDVAEAADVDPIVRCWKCSSIVELIDGDNRFDPAVIEEVGELHPFPSYEEKP